MTKEEFVAAIKTHITQYNYTAAITNLNSEIPDKVPNEVYLKMMEFYHQQNNEQKKVINNFISLIIDNMASSFLSVIDGVSDIGQKGEFELFYVEGGKSTRINEDKGNYLIDYYWDN